MTRKCPAVVRTWSSFDWKGMDIGHAWPDSKLLDKWPQWAFPLPVNWAMKTLFWKSSLNGPSGINTESLRISWQRCIFRVLVISKQLCHFFLAYCKMCYILLIFLRNVLYIVVEYLDLLSEALFNEILYDCPTIFTNISVDKSSNRNRILYFFLCSHSWPHTTADLLIEKNVMKEVNSDL